MWRLSGAGGVGGEGGMTPLTTLAGGRCHFINLLNISGRRECVKVLISGERVLICVGNFARVVFVTCLYYDKISRNRQGKEKILVLLATVRHERNRLCDESSL